MLRRSLQLPDNHSFFLFGARGTGKSTLLREHFGDAAEVLWLDLLDPAVELRYGRDPGLLTQVLAANQNLRWVVIDEVQKAPKLLDIVHHHIEARRCHFALTGSSARKLKVSGANMLAGRAFVEHLYPLTYSELGANFSLTTALHYGTLPKLLEYSTESERLAYLRAYAGTYLREEVWGEQLVRDLDPFRRFIEVAAQANGKILSYAKIARDVGVDDKTVKSYFAVLEDTLVGYILEPFVSSFRKRLAQKPKFYFFDVGIARTLARTVTVPLQPSTYAYGEAFEHLVILEILRGHGYKPRDFRFSYLRTKDDAEVDLVIERPGQSTIFLEIKSSDHVDESAVKKLARLAADAGSNVEPMILCQELLPRHLGGVLLLPWQAGIERIYS